MRKSHSCGENFERPHNLIQNAGGKLLALSLFVLYIVM